MDKQFTTPRLVILDTDMSSPPTDSMVRMVLATIRDTLRMGRGARSKAEMEAALSSPGRVRLWEVSPRQLYMPVSKEYHVIEKGKC